jgi:hypothetical protein
VLTTAHRDRIVRSLVEAITLFDLELAATLQPEPAGPAPALENSDEEAPLDEAQLTGDETPNAPVS